MTVTIGGGDGFEPIGIAHANGCPSEPCLHRVPFLHVYPFYTCTLFTRVPFLHVYPFYTCTLTYTLTQDLHVYTFTPDIFLTRLSMIYTLQL
jgi:hypothetical protein